jgi:hypothetical protein
MGKARVNVTVDSILLRKAQRKLGMFGGKLSTLFNAFLSDFVKSAEQGHGDLSGRVRELEKRVERLEKS